MLKFILNDQSIETALPAGSTVLDFVRYQKRLMGTKIGCREGDCGACTILVGDFENERLVYRTMTSCLMPLGNASGKHIVTVEGINLDSLNEVQQAMVDTNGTQCGFCTIGFVMSLTGFAMHHHAGNTADAIDAMSGNICRCTGYKSIERAAQMIAEKIADKPESETIPWLVEHKFIPTYFLDIKMRMKQLKESISIPTLNFNRDEMKISIAGGTDLMVQKHGEVKKAVVKRLFDAGELKEIYLENHFCHVGASVTVTAFAESGITKEMFPELDQYIKLVASAPIRNMATMGGNLVNASPIGDMSIFFLALDSELVLNNGSKKRTVKLREFYKDYKKVDKAENELVEKIIFRIPESKKFNSGLKTYFNFEKVCKRTWLDIASVNSASQLTLDKGGNISGIHLSAGGVAPYPKYLTKTAAFLNGKKLSSEIILSTMKIMDGEIAPISDARGTAAYKKFLLRQLFIAHLIKFFGMSDMIRDVLKQVKTDE